ncbi:septal ring lytic transglycosylase RlpA family protein [Polymorphobacter arshaanensis]|uniref:Endolytic peptidoglycan transglycosylase RlpA n=1 Tax=Glacieibacterium arshaanense TaxID=2511025 RepID=A0A4Y9ET24_9SPHN|nr:septal ring lytic transglycosylase RlpA family protein [Polymorphobacter arshaanensis]
MRLTNPATRAAALALLLTLAACADKTAKPPASAGSKPATSAGSKVKIGKPYEVLGVWYTPSDDRSYDAVGIASWYGPGFHGLDTANGERYEMDALTAAHKTLPMPSYVEVTNLNNGRVLTVRINDRGPFVDGRIIDLSRRAAQLLGIDKAGTAKVRVRRVFPDAEQIAALAPLPQAVAVRAPAPVVAPVAAADVAAAPAEVAPVDTTPAPVAVVAVPPAAVAAMTVVPPPTQQLFIQVAAVSDQGRAEWLRSYLAPYGTVTIAAAPSGLWRVRIGPVSDADSAASTLARVQAAGYSDAAIVRVAAAAPPR